MQSNNFYQFLDAINQRVSRDGLVNLFFSLKSSSSQQEIESMQYIIDNLPFSYPSVSVDQFIIQTATERCTQSMYQMPPPDFQQSQQSQQSNFGNQNFGNQNFGNQNFTNQNFGINLPHPEDPPYIPPPPTTSTFVDSNFDRPPEPYSFTTTSTVPTTNNNLFSAISNTDHNNFVNQDPPKTRDHSNDQCFKTCSTLIAISWLGVILLIALIAGPSIEQQYLWKVHIGCDITYTSTTKTAIYTDDEGVVISATIKDRCKPKYSSQGITETDSSCWISPRDNKKAKVLPDFKFSSTKAATAFMVLNPFFFNLPLVIYVLVNHIDERRFWIVLAPFFLVIFPIFAAVLMFKKSSKKYMWPLAIWMIIVDIIFIAGLMGPAISESNRLEQTTCYFFNRVEAISCPGCDYILDYSSCQNAFNEVYDSYHSKESYYVKLVPDDKTSLIGSVYFPWVIYDFENERPSNNTHGNTCWSEKDYSSSSGKAPESTTKLLKDKGMYKGGAAGLGVVTAISCLLLFIRYMIKK
ncbi:hypothetical protein M0811_01256 [Anaeramoeba ignava]|uniref:Transmembrane protein n=1 Tax=Anaeramoeba ignava TaxID=1746090 RepID=A0A9Q0LG28_ANAIG|nr:hypothetical protein M0811_01256 [Anaeramoeba ignava]